MAEQILEQFLGRVLKVIGETFPLVSAAEGEAAFSVRINGHAVSLENIYRIVLAKPEESKRSIERWVVELLRAAEGTPDRSGSFDELRDRILPMLIGPDGTETDDEMDDEAVREAGDIERGIITMPLVGG